MPQALALLDGTDGIGPEAVEQLPSEAIEWLRSHLLETGKSALSDSDVVATTGGMSLRFSHAGQISSSEHLLRVAEVVGGGPTHILRMAFDLTEREAEVLMWIANGKSNKEIAAILDMSPAR